MNPKLEEIKTECSEKDWDSYGASAVTQESLEKADFMLEWFKGIGAKNPYPVPTVDGGIQLEWHTGGISVELEITPNGEDCRFNVFKDCKAILMSGRIDP